jgi:predicted Rossmann-fold nucleotide-binding protein
MAPELATIGVYCASSTGTDPVFAAAAASMGRLLAEQGIRLVYGGGHVGLMGVLADAQLGIHTKPCGVLNVDRHFDPLSELLARASDEQFIRPQHRDLIIVESDSATLLDRLRAWTPVTTDKWLDRSER